MRRFMVLLLLWAPFLLGVNLAAAQAPQRGGTREEGIELSSSEEGIEQGAVSTSFNLLHLRDLWVRVRVARLPRTAMLRLTFTSPRGEVFYESNVLFSRDPRVTEADILGAPHPITAFPAKRLRGGFALDQAIPIGVGVFMRYPQPGTWLVQATLDGHPEALAVRMDLSVAP